MGRQLGRWHLGCCFMHLLRLPLPLRLMLRLPWHRLLRLPLYLLLRLHQLCLPLPSRLRLQSCQLPELRRRLLLRRRPPMTLTRRAVLH